MAYKVGDRVRLLSDLPLVAPMMGVIPAGTLGTIASNDMQFDVWAVTFDWPVMGLVVFCNTERLERDTTDQLALLRAQLAARDAALDAVLKFATQAHERPETFGSGWGSELLVMLTKHGVNPK